MFPEHLLWIASIRLWAWTNASEAPEPLQGQSLFTPSQQDTCNIAQHSVGMNQSPVLWCASCFELGCTTFSQSVLACPASSRFRLESFSEHASPWSLSLESLSWKALKPYHVCCVCCMRRSMKKSEDNNLGQSYSDITHFWIFGGKISLIVLRNFPIRLG